LESLLRESIQRDPGLAGEKVGDLFAAGGKRLRPGLVLLCGHLGSYDLGVLRRAAMAVEFTHAATLIHDDVIDGSDLRRGRATVVAEHGPGTAIVVGDYYFAKAYEEASRTGSAEVVDLLAGAVQSVCLGELMQQADRYRYRPGEEHYLQRIRHKTADLLAVSCRIGAVLAGLPSSDARRLTRFGEMLGTAFQIVDDVLDYAGTEAQLGKPIGQDLLEGNATLPLLLAFKMPEVEAELGTLLHDGVPLEADRVRAVVELVFESGACDAALDRAASIAAKAKAQLAPYLDRPAGAALAGLADYVVTRKL
jgi:heptaprenyl diphosphate synthase